MRYINLHKQWMGWESRGRKETIKKSTIITVEATIPKASISVLKGHNLSFFLNAIPDIFRSETAILDRAVLLASFLQGKIWWRIREKAFSGEVSIFWMTV